MNPFFLSPPALPYAETHYKFKFPWSPLFKKVPEIFIDGPRFCVPGKQPVFYLAIKDADYFPVRICDVSVNLQFGDKSETRRLETDVHADKHLEFIPLEMGFPSNAGVVQINAKISLERKNGKRLEILNSNLSGLPMLPASVQMLRDPLPYPSHWRAGEIHCHSHYSNNPIEFGAPFHVLQQAGEALGLGYTVTTDHSWDFYYDKSRYMIPVDPGLIWNRYRREALACNTLCKESDGPVMIPGEEVSCGNHQGKNVHLLVMGYPGFLPGLGDGGRRWFNNRPCRSIGEVLDLIGETPSFAAHPRVRMGWLEKLVFRRGTWNGADIPPTPSHNQITGLQFWNGHRHHDFSLGRAFWVQQLLQGKKMVPAAGNDAHGDLNRHTGVKVPLFYLYHSLNHVYGIVRTLVESPEKSVEGIQQGMRRGNQICTDGPFLLLEKENSRLVLNAASTGDFGGIWKLHLFSGKAGDVKETVVKSWEFPARTFSCTETWNGCTPVSYYRAEVWTHKNKLAICSPVFLN